MSRGEATALYLARARTLSSYRLHPDDGALSPLAELVMPNVVQSAWAHPRLPVLYVSCGEPPPGSSVGDWVCAVALDPETGVRGLLGDPVRIAGRALDLTTDPAGGHLLLAHTRPASISVRRLGPDGTIGEVVEQQTDPGLGVFPHQVRVTSDGRRCLCVCRGLASPHPWRASRDPQTEPGSLHVIDLDDGRLGAATTLTLGDGRHFGPRNLDTDATGTTYYLGLETQNEVVVLSTAAGGRPEPVPRQRLSTLARPDAEIHQGLGPVLMNPAGTVLYVANRAYQPRPDADRVLPVDAENTVVVYAVGPRDRLLTEVQRLDSGGVCPRSLSLDLDGRTLVVANSETYRVGDVTAAEVAMNLATFRVRDDGRLEPLARHPVGDGSGAPISWAGLAATS
ncbi:lactonase family protein [Microlunatus flavus]|uniref:6-phosphogluconolactonase, cycloisomerase 2 family n=1 Tax=Microlunatus flavus TaxID=1036181 RepID=A0A1H9L0C4_9ACTN|nr:beta-propeller fold lactonase family protein [Microlunatus flavus]SER04846.1 6-phosphogluconolactonase, cycloisomerase 2 family [Microlunatus flavus]